MEGIIQKRIEWIEKRTPLSDMAKHYIAFQMQLYAEYYHEQQVKSVDLADVVLSEERAELVCDNCFGEGCRYTVWNTKMACSFCGGTGKQTN
jgi:ubiquitin